ncbi:hypothetical protein CVT26_004830 [Gymnopilus dilepis]|uniref:Uncharacterized protein n=1 Tax=Gymnopilus dilepis TaxID=231916 RepID=A0A409XZP6_9AGAR|nr:hypothetical protein CVT26_004830 [Gymnopilus dilepis]
MSNATVTHLNSDLTSANSLHTMLPTRPLVAYNEECCTASPLLVLEGEQVERSWQEQLSHGERDALTTSALAAALAHNSGKVVVFQYDLSSRSLTSKKRKAA